MTGPRMSRRAEADRLAALLEGGRADAADEGAVATVDADEQALLLLASALRESTPPVEPMRAEFRAELRAQVIDAAREQRAEPALLTRVRDRIHRWRYSTGVVTGSSVAAMALSGGGVAAAAEGAQPGELLYPVKTGIEDLRLALAGDDLTAGRHAVTYAFDRMVEAAHAAREGDDAAAATALDGAADRMAEGTQRLVAAGLLEPLLSLADAVNAQEGQLQQLLPLLGAEGNVAANGLFDVLAESRNAIGTAVVPSDGSVPDVEGPPALPLPDSSATPTPTPEVTTPPVDADDASEAPDASTDSPLLPLPEVPLPDLQVPTEPLPLPLPPPPSDTGDVVEGVDEAVQDVEDAVEGVGGTVDDVIEESGQVIEDTVDAVTEPVEEVLPAPVQSTVESTVEDLGGTTGETVDDVGDTLGTVDDAVQGVEDVTSGILGGG